MLTNETINEALAICDAASKGPAVHAGDPNDTAESALGRFAAHYNKALAVTGSTVSYQVDLPDERTEIDGTALCFAVTGNGPHGRENARFISAALHPAFGYEAALRKFQRALDLIDEFESRNDPADGWLTIQQLGAVLRG